MKKSLILTLFAAALAAPALPAWSHADHGKPQFGGIVAEAATVHVLLTRCRTVWLTAAPEEHMDRVVAQGDLRPMSGNREAMADLKLILAERTPFYAKADLRFDTSGKPLAQCLAELKTALAVPAG